jgi:ATP-dependent DNA ligase
VKLPIKIPFAPMEASTSATIPTGPEWQYEPKWDGFRCLAFRDGDEVELQSKSGKPLTRYFPEVVDALLQLKASKFAIDGEIIVPLDGGLSFDRLLMRIHPAASRVKHLSEEHPAKFIVFDLLVDERGTSLISQTLKSRRKELERFAKKFFKDESIALSPAATDLATAKLWFKKMGGGLDGVIAKRLDSPYDSGERTAMLKIKNLRTADCVAGGFRYSSKGKAIGSILLGLYDEHGLLHHVGFTSSIPVSERKAITRKLTPLIHAPGFTGRAPGGPSRWSTRESESWEPLKPKLVLEVQYDHFTGHRFRHGTKLLRWRPDKAPPQCTMSQVEKESRSPLTLLK